MQNGATLIVVLILLLVITVVGVIAIRGSITALNIATNSQAQQLLLQNSDSAIFNVENPDLIALNTSLNGVFGKVKTDANKGKELVFCYRGLQSQFYQSSKASFIKWFDSTAPNNSEIGLDGYCKLDNSTNFFTSGRKAVMTQIAVKVDTDPTNLLVGLDQAFGYMQKGTDVDKAKVVESNKILVIATSIIPAMSSASDTDINACFNSHMNQVVIPNGVNPALGMGRSVASCLQDLGVPVQTQISEYNLTQTLGRST